MSTENKWEHEPMQWDNEGVEPSNSLKQNGFAGGYKPPAGVMNRILNKFYKCVKEIQDRVYTKAEVDNITNSMNMHIIDTMNNPHKVTAEQVGAAKKDLSNVDNEVLKQKVESAVVTGIPIVEATSTDGVTYNVDISDKYDNIYNGLQIIIIANMLSNTTTPTLRVTTKNGVADRIMSLGTTQNTGLYQQPSNVDFIAPDTPITITFNTRVNRAMITDYQIVRASNLYGNVPIEKGGTGATTGEQALINLGGAKKTHTHELASYPNTGNDASDFLFSTDGFMSGQDKGKLDKLVHEPVVATSTDGVLYTATVNGITKLYNGMEITIIPDKKSESTGIKLNLNGLGEVPIRRPLSFSTFVSTPIDSDRLYFLSADTPCRLMYHANYTTGGIWLMADKVKVSAQDLYGTVPIESGGTGATTVEGAIANLGLNGFVEMIIGSYNGTGEEEYTENNVFSDLGYKPKKIEIVEADDSCYLLHCVQDAPYGVLTTSTVNCPQLTWSDTGVTISRISGKSSKTFNKKDMTYHYVIYK